MLRHALPIERAGATFYVLRQRDILEDDRRHDHIARLAGTVIVAQDEVVITVYRNSAPIHHVLRKRKYVQQRDRPVGCPDDMAA